MTKTILAVFAAVVAATAFTSNSIAQSAGTYQLLAAGTSGGEKGYCSIGTVTIKSNKTIAITTKNPLDPSPAPKFTGTISSRSISTSAGTKKLKGTVTYAGTKYVYGDYVAYSGAKKIGAGKFSMTKK
jgi:hypothetical protein